MPAAVWRVPHGNPEAAHGVLASVWCKGEALKNIVACRALESKVSGYYCYCGLDASLNNPVKQTPPRLDVCCSGQHPQLRDVLCSGEGMAWRRGVRQLENYWSKTMKDSLVTWGGKREGIRVTLLHVNHSKHGKKKKYINILNKYICINTEANNNRDNLVCICVNVMFTCHQVGTNIYGNLNRDFEVNTLSIVEQGFKPRCHEQGSEPRPLSITLYPLHHTG